MRSWFIGVVAACSCLFFALTAEATTITPQAVTLEVAPNVQTQQTLKIQNLSDESRVYTVDAAAVIFGDSADELVFEELDVTQSAWVTFDRTEIEIASGSEQEVTVYILPDEAADGQVFTFAVIATEQIVEQPGVNVASGLASIFFVSVGEVDAPRLEIESFEIVPKNTHKPPVRFAALLTNVGVGLSQPQVGVAIKNIWGKEVAILNLNATGRRLPGNTNRVFSAEWEASGLRFGPYTAELYVFPDASDVSLEASTNVVLFPGRILVIFLAAIGVFMSVVLTLRRWRRS